MAINPNTTFVAGAVLTAAQMTRLPWGIMAYAAATSNQTGITATADITSLTVTYTAVATRYYRTTVYLPDAFQVTANSQSIYTIADGSNTVKQLGNFFMLATEHNGVTLTLIETGISGSITRKARAFTNAGTLTIQSAASSPSYISVEDIGQA